MLSDADRALITNVIVADSLRFAAGQGFIRTRTLTYNVGKQGPFTAQIDWVDFNPQNIDAIYQREINGLRAAGIDLSGS